MLDGGVEIEAMHDAENEALVHLARVGVVAGDGGVVRPDRR